MIKFFILFFCFISFFSFGQKESNLSKYKNENKKIILLTEYCEELLQNGKFKLLRNNAKKGVLLTMINDFEHLSIFNFYIGNSFDYQTESDSLIFYLEKSETFLKKSKNKKNTTRLLKEMLYAYKTFGYSKKREQIIADYQKIIDTTKAINQKILLQENLADYYLSIG